MDTKKTPFLRLATINSDESTVAHATRTVALLHPDTLRYLDGVTATVRLMPAEEYEALQQKHRSIPEKTPKGVEWKLDTKKLFIETLVATLESWSGIVGADNKPMKLCPAAIAALDDNNKAHLVSVARTPADVIDAEVVEASFRESADVAGVAG